MADHKQNQVASSAGTVNWLLARSQGRGAWPWHHKAGLRGEAAKLAVRLWTSDKVYVEAMNTHVESDEVLEGAFGAHTPDSHRNLKGDAPGSKAQVFSSDSQGLEQHHRFQSGEQTGRTAPDLTFETKKCAPGLERTSWMPVG